MNPLISLSAKTITEINPTFVNAIETPVENGTVDISALYEILAGLPDQIMAVLLAYLCFKTFLDMVK
jgi:hypothetical protein